MTPHAEGGVKRTGLASGFGLARGINCWCDGRRGYEKYILDDMVSCQLKYTTQLKTSWLKRKTNRTNEAEAQAEAELCRIRTMILERQDHKISIKISSDSDSDSRTAWWVSECEFNFIWIEFMMQFKVQPLLLCSLCPLEDTSPNKYINKRHKTEMNRSLSPAFFLEQQLIEITRKFVRQN